MYSASTVASAEQTILDLLKARASAIRSRDSETLLRLSAPSIVLYDALDSLQRVGLAESAAKTKEWLEGYEGPIGFETRDLVIAANNDLGFAHYLFRVTGTMTNGNAVDMWVRSTVGLQNIEGRWQITHEHVSVPFDAASGQALSNLTP